MYNYVYVEFPNSTVGPTIVTNLSIHQNRYKHEVAVIKFRDWNVGYDSVTNGSPIYLTVTRGSSVKEFKGYVHSINSDHSPSHNITEVMAISASYVMKNPSQKIYKGLSADAIIKQICNKYRFNSFCTPHPRVYPQVSQAGHTDWEIMVRLAKQSGYSLRTEGTEVYFQPVLAEYTSKRSESSVFVRRDASNPNGSTLYSFTADISEAIDYDGDEKAAIAISGLDNVTKSPVSITQQLRNKTTKTKSKAEFFDKFATEVVAPNAAVAKYESDAAEQRASFPYRATAVVTGDPTVRPDLPVYLDGVGDYSGYWVILGTEHIVEEQQRTQFLYTTKLYLGTDSLGDAATWIDGQTITTPTSTATRALVPGVLQTNTPPSSTLLVTAPNVSPQSTGQFSVATNRSGATTNGRTINNPYWVASNPVSSSTPQTPQTTPSFPNRLLNNMVVTP